MNIFDMLDASDLMKFASFSPRFQRIIVDHYIIGKYRLHETTISLIVADSVSIEYKSDDEWIPLITDNFDDSLTALQLFGKVFKHLNIQITYTSGYKIVERVQAAVNKYCTNAIQKVEVIDYNCHDESKKVNVSFPNAADVAVRTWAFEPRYPFSLNSAFPKMKKLDLDCRADELAHYPYLEEMSIGVAFGYPRLFASDISDLVQLNPQVRRMKTAGFNIPTYFEELSKLPNLEYLTVGLLSKTDYDDVFTTARFRKVKEFALDVDEYKTEIAYFSVPEALLDSIEFVQLESFSFTIIDFYSERKMIFLIGMVLKNVGLQKVMVNTQCIFDYADKLIAGLPHLRELNIIWHRDSRGVRLKQFLERVVTEDRTLERFTVRFQRDAEVMIKSLLPFIPQGWRYVEMEVSSSPKLLQLHRSE